jgi:hypothetical protein
VAGHPRRRRREFSFVIDVRPPFRLDLTAWAIRRRSINETDRWDGSAYRRTVYVGQTPVGLAVTQVGSHDLPRLLVDVSGEGDCTRVRSAAHCVLDHVLGLGIDVAGFYALAAAEPPLDELARRFRGMRPPRYPSVFEALANGVACQQISLQAGLTVLNRFVAAFGQAPRLSPEGKGHFPNRRLSRGLMSTRFGLLASALPRAVPSARLQAPQFGESSRMRRWQTLTMQRRVHHWKSYAELAAGPLNMCSCAAVDASMSFPETMWAHVTTCRNG